MIERIRLQYALQELDVKSASYNNQPIQTEAMVRNKREAFLRVYEEKGLDAAYDQAFSDPLHFKLRNLATRILKYKRRGKK